MSKELKLGGETVRSKKALINTATSLLLQFVTVISGFIVPRIIIGTYGSEQEHDAFHRCGAGANGGSCKGSGKKTSGC